MAAKLDLNPTVISATKHQTLACPPIISLFTRTLVRARR